MPSDRRTLSALVDIRDNILSAQQFVSALSYDEFAASQLHVYAAIRAIEIISEASRRLPDDLRERHPHLPWRAIRDSGNVYRHQYDGVADTLIWAVVQERLPELLKAVTQEIATLERRDVNS